jgi:hypothetical protein
MDRTIDLNPAPPAAQPPVPMPVPPPVLPPIDWGAVGHSAPAPVPLGPRQPNDALPSADIVIITWSSAEWSALDHVFLGSATPRTVLDTQWKSAWLPYARGSADYVGDPGSGPLWGLFQLVRIVDRSARPWRVLLFKSNTHLAHPPWIAGLSAMIRAILQDATPDRVYSIGTAGGTSLGQRLGDSVITNSAQLDLRRPQNTTDPDNGALFRCPTWFPATTLFQMVEQSLLYRMSEAITDDSLGELFAALQAKHAADGAMEGLSLQDLVNDPIRPSDLGSPRIVAAQDVPLLTTDFYYITGGGADAHSFLEMDDAVIARECELAGVRYAFVRNVSDPVISASAQGGTAIPAVVRSDWSALIYTQYGGLTSFNGALAAWATIAGEGDSAYAPPRSADAPFPDDPIEVKLAYQVRSCGTCSFFWPDEKKGQSYGPYTTYDFIGNAPYAAPFETGAIASRWIVGTTRPPAFPEPEIMDGCRKAPIMTIGINPNLTAFAPGQTGAAWCYPSFSSDNDTDAWTKYAWYYRYRSIFQERLDLDFVRRFILPDGRIFAARPGHITTALRPDDGPAWTIQVRYDGDPADTVIQLPGTPADFPYVTLFDTFPPNNVFKAGDVIAGKLAVPGGIRVEIQQQPQTYYVQFAPVLQGFQTTLQNSGHPNARLRIGEDVCQLDMIACASPHWNPGFLGGTPAAVNLIVDNCVSKNAWVVKQLVQTQPAVLYIVSGSSWNMFRGSLGAYAHRTPPLPSNPVDGDFTLLRATTDPDHPLIFSLQLVVDGREYNCSTRIVITPHFSYDVNFLPQFRLSPEDFASFSKQFPDCLAALTPVNGFQVIPGTPPAPANHVPPASPGSPANPVPPPNPAAAIVPPVVTPYTAVRMLADPSACLAYLAQNFTDASEFLQLFYYDPHAMMAGVLDDLFKSGSLVYQTNPNGTEYLARNAGSCKFCVNQRWQLPLGCPYGKNLEPPPPPGWLERVAQQVAAGGRPPSPSPPASP